MKKVKTKIRYELDDEKIVEPASIWKRIFARFLDIFLVQAIAFIFFLISLAIVNNEYSIGQYFTLSISEVTLLSETSVDIGYYQSTINNFYTLSDGIHQIDLTINTYDIASIDYGLNFLIYYISIILLIFINWLILPMFWHGRSIGKFILKIEIINLNPKRKKDTVYLNIILREIPIAFLFLIQNIILISIGFRVSDFYHPYVIQVNDILRTNFDNLDASTVFIDDSFIDALDKNWISEDDWNGFQDKFKTYFDLDTLQFIHGVHYNGEEINFINVSNFVYIFYIFYVSLQGVIAFNFFLILIIIAFTTNQRGYHDYMGNTAVVDFKKKYNKMILEDQVQFLDDEEKEQAINWEEKNSELY